MIVLNVILSISKNLIGFVIIYLFISTKKDPIIDGVVTLKDGLIRASVLFCMYLVSFRWSIEFRWEIGPRIEVVIADHPICFLS